MTFPITSNVGVFASLSVICAFFFFLEQRTRWKLFNFLPPLLFIYAVPLILTNTRLLPASSPVYGSIKEFVLPMMIVLLLLKVDVLRALRVFGRGVGVMLFGTAGVVLGAPVAYLLFRRWLEPETWKAYATLAGSWIGGTGNMTAASDMVGASGTEYGLALLGDTTIYTIWLPIMLGSKKLAGWFANFTKVSAEQVEAMDRAAEDMSETQVPPSYRDLIYLLAIGLTATWISNLIAVRLPVIENYVDAGTWRVLIVTTVGIALSTTPLRRIPSSHEMAMACVYLYVARMGASADLGDVAQYAVPFLLSALVWIFIHGGFCLLGAKLFKVDVHIAAIASAANIGGAASAPIVAAHHKESLVPASILLALIGYAVGTYAAYATGVLCRLVAMS